MNALHAMKRLKAEGWTIQSSNVIEDDMPERWLYVWFNDPNGATQFYGTAALNIPMAWLKLDRYLAFRAAKS